MDPIKVYGLDQYGVIVDTNPIANPLGALTKAQNAIADPLGELGAIRKRPGLKRINISAASGAIQGGVGVPLFVGSAGPILVNPFVDTPVSILDLTDAIFDLVVPPTFDDESKVFDYDPLIDFDEVLDEGEDGDILDVADDGPGIDTTGVPTTSGKVAPLFFVGNWDGTPSWYLALDASTSTHTDNRTSYPNSRLPLVFPTANIRAQGAGSLTNYGMKPWTTNGGRLLDGRPTCQLNGVMYYVAGVYTRGTDYPTVRAYDGYTDTIAFAAPLNPDVSSTVPPNAIVSLLAANGLIYFSTFDGGVGDTDGGTVQGSVYQFDPSTGAITKLGATFPTKYMPYSLLWAYGRLWCGTASNNMGNSSCPIARLYWIRPGIDTAWTLDHTFESGLNAVTALAIFQGQIYAATLFGQATTAGTARVKVRSTLGVWSDSDTRTIGVGNVNVGAGYFDLLVWPDENSPQTAITPNLYNLSRDSTDNTSSKSAVRKTADGVTWTTVLDNGSALIVNLGSVYSTDLSSSKILPVICAYNSPLTEFYSSIDGATFTERHAQGGAGLITVGQVASLLARL